MMSVGQVNIGAAHADRLHGQQHVLITDFRNRNFADLYTVRF
jgi:hypothetical protein